VLNSAGVMRRMSAAGVWGVVSGGGSTGCGARSRPVNLSVDVSPLPL
jgi:hypothetical protein